MSIQNGRFREHNRLMRYHPKETPVDRTCNTCGIVFKYWASLLRHGKAGMYCSRECHLVSCRVTVVCDYCQESFTRAKCYAGRFNNKNYCSRSCTSLARRKNPDKIAIKRLRYGSTEFKKARKSVIERDGICQICSDSLANSVHHLDWNPYNNDLENLILLCKSCHGRFKHFESFETAKDRIVACSDPQSDLGRMAEMPIPADFQIS